MTHNADKTVEVSSIWLRRIGKKAQVLVRVGGVWKVAIEEHADANYSHAAHACGADTWKDVETGIAEGS